MSSNEWLLLIVNCLHAVSIYICVFLGRRGDRAEILDKVIDQITEIFNLLEDFRLCSYFMD